MKIIIPVIVLSVFAAACGKIQTEAQIRASNTAIVVNRPSTTPVPTQTNSIDMARVDFKNYTFPDFNDEKSAKTFTLKNGVSKGEQGLPTFTLRKTYLFDLLGDSRNEAVSHIIVEGCSMGCDRSNLFYIHTAGEKQPVLFWKIANGGDVLGGLKSANFSFNEVIMEVFGSCKLENGVIKPEVDLRTNAKLKTTNYTRFVFTANESGYIQTAREVFPLPSDFNLVRFRPQIIFGEPF